MKPPTALTIAGTDSGGGAGVAADLKTFADHGVWGMCAVTAVTAQNTVGVQAAVILDPGMVVAQIASVASDIGVTAAKTGMLGNAAVIRAVAKARAGLLPGPLVVDPVAVATTGAVLLDEDGIPALRHDLLPLADLVTPNLAEAAALTGVAAIIDRPGMVAAGRTILSWGPGAVLVKGGHLAGPEAPDLLLVRGEEPRWLEGRRVAGRNTHGTGCVLSAAITARLARGEDLPAAVAAAKTYVARGIAAGVELGAGAGPVNPGPET